MYLLAGLLNLFGFVLAFLASLVLIWTGDTLAAKLMLTGLSCYAVSFPLSFAGITLGIDS